MRLFLRLAVIIVLSFGFVTTVVAEKAPDFRLPTDKGPVRLSALQGQVVYVDFWATWCTPCRKSFPWMNEMHAKYADDGLKIIAVSLDAEKSMVKKFVKKFPADFLIAYDPKGTSAEKYDVKGMPSSYLIDRKGNLVETHIGFRNSDREPLEKKIKAVLGKK
jgi:thiol-disulfide isomerase/thioredoxin